MMCIWIMCVLLLLWVLFFFKQKTAYEMRISDWSSDVCSSDLLSLLPGFMSVFDSVEKFQAIAPLALRLSMRSHSRPSSIRNTSVCSEACGARVVRSEEHTSELQSLMRISYAVFCLKKKNMNTSQYT